MASIRIDDENTASILNDDGRVVYTGSRARVQSVWDDNGIELSLLFRTKSIRLEDAIIVERVLCAAIWVDTGVAEPPRRSYSYPATGLLFCGWRHADCFTTLNAWADRLTPEERQRIGEEQLAGRSQGFLTSTGRYVSREEAMKIARAARQTESDKSGLFSEDLY